jgi:hypothetical protein
MPSYQDLDPEKKRDLVAFLAQLKGESDSGE